MTHLFRKGSTRAGVGSTTAAAVEFWVLAVMKMKTDNDFCNLLCSIFYIFMIIFV